MSAVRGWAKALMWVGILLACAAVGAFIASRSNPFPPGVPDPGAVPSETPAPSPQAEVTRWTLAMTSRSTHTYRVGGSCTSDWRMERGRIRVSGSGRVRGRGIARLLPGASCDFPSAQLQARRVGIEILGRRDGNRLRIRFRTAEVRPPGSQDLGAFVETLERLRLALRERPRARASERERIERSDGDVFASVARFRLLS
ncbi:MAG TPA: hypothetical protein VFZ75_04015 [Actinomycetota bacterium]|nr:hypothetical protein [Actinomycetota bacterium]